MCVYHSGTDHGKKKLLKEVFSDDEEMNGKKRNQDWLSWYNNIKCKINHGK